MWLLVINTEALVALNATHADRQIVPIIGERGGLLVNGDLLADSCPGCYWEDYAEWLRSLQETNELPIINT